MQLGDYVRTKFGTIGKVIKEEPFMKEILIFLDNKKGDVIYDTKDGVYKVNHKKDIIKSSPNIIDLIEPMDLLYIDIEYGFAGGLVVPRIYETQAELDEAIEKIKNDEERELVGIVTHEQLENMMYEVKNERL